jgi:hypothetical protein
MSRLSPSSFPRVIALLPDGRRPSPCRSSSSSLSTACDRGAVEEEEGSGVRGEATGSSSSVTCAHGAVEAKPHFPRGKDGGGRRRGRSGGRRGRSVLLSTETWVVWRRRSHSRRTTFAPIPPPTVLAVLTALLSLFLLSSPAFLEPQVIGGRRAPASTPQPWAAAVVGAG